jgi:hypothetical protein
MVRFYSPLVAAVRVVLGLEFIINGLNWWYKLIGDYPSIVDFQHGRSTDSFVGAMIKTGILFHLVKGSELLAGIGLLTNRFVPLALVISFPVTVNVFIVDVLISQHLRAHVMGTGAMLMSVVLMIAYLRYYAPMLTMRSEVNLTPSEEPARDGPLSSIYRSLDRSPGPLTALAAVALVWGLVMLAWVGVMMVQYRLAT